MSILNSVSACCRFTDEDETKLSLEEAFDFDIILEKDEAESIGMDLNKGSEYHLCLRVNIMGEIEDAVYSYNIKNGAPMLSLPVTDDYESVVNDIADYFVVCDIAMCTDKNRFKDYIRAISERQPGNPISVFLGGFYNEVMHEYSGYHLIIYKYGVGMINKVMHLSDDTLSHAWVLDDDVKEQAEPKSDLMRSALTMKHEQTIIDNSDIDSDFELKERLYSITPQAKEEGIQEIRRMSQNLKMPVFPSVINIPDKPEAKNIIDNICQNIRKISHK